MQKHMNTHTFPTVRLEHLWVALSLSIIGMFISLSPTAPNDFWWHLKVGQLIATQGLPTSNLFAWSLPIDTPFIYQSWLGEWLLYILYRIGGFPLIVFVRNILGLTTFALVAVEARRRSGSWRLAAGVVLIAAAMTMNNVAVRTQMWSWLPFNIMFLILSRYTDEQLEPHWLLSLPLLMIFWVNVHGAFMMGLLLPLAFAVGETLQWLLRQSYALSPTRLRLLYLTCGLTLVATTLNPLGLGVFGYVRKLLSNTFIQTLINEWQPPTPDNLAGTFFYFSVLLLLAAVALARRRPKITDILLVCGFGWLAFNSFRSVVWFGMATMPIVAQCAAYPITHIRNATLIKRSISSANMSVVIFLTLIFVLVQPWFKSLLPLPQPYQDLFAPIPGGRQLFSNSTPVAATEHLRTEPCAGHLFNELGYGSYLIWALYPQTHVFIDPRIELYPQELWQDYVTLTQGNNVEKLLTDYDIHCLLIDRTYQPYLVDAMAKLPHWRRTYADTQSEVWRRIDNR